MVEIIHAPDPQTLLPPLLACLPTAFASYRPPPALLPLLSPVLRQRLELLSSGSAHDNWLRSLCWDSNRAEHLKEQVENATFEPHPASGEIEVGDVEAIRYKRLDEETLRAQMSLSEWPFTPVYLWCTGGKEGNAWKLAEVLPSDEEFRDDHTWSTTIQDANESASERIVAEALLAAEASSAARKLSVPGDDDDYWAQYDRSAHRTPVAKSPANGEGNSTTDADYYQRYGSVQPALDSHDPEEEVEDIGPSGLNGNALHQMISGRSESQQESIPPPYQDPMDTGGDDKDVELNQPVPASPSSRAGSDNVARLERTAERYAASEIGIRQHISTSLKSMFRLARSSGMDREEFERIVQRELETLSFLDRDDD